MLRPILFFLALPLAAQTLMPCDENCSDTSDTEPGKSSTRLATTKIRRTIHRPTNAALFQSAIDSARGGDEIHLTAGVTYTGNFRLPGKPSLVTIRTSNLSWSSPGVRVAPFNAPKMARIQSPNEQPALFFGKSAGNWSIIGVEIAGAASAHTINVVLIGDLGGATSTSEFPNNISIERSYVHGDSVLGGRRGILTTGTNITVKDSYISDFFAPGNDTQAILVCEGLGPTLIENNFLEAAGENLFLAQESTLIRGHYPENIRIRRNHLKKRLGWKPPNSVVVKNLFEIKSARHVIFEDNVLENNWASHQNGFAVLFTCRDENGDNACEIIDVVFRNNKIMNTANGIALLGKDDSAGNIGRVSGIRIENNLLVGPVGRGFLFLNGIENVAVSHNTFAGTTSQTWVSDQQQNGNITFINNIVGRGEYGMFHSGVGEGTASILAGWRSFDIRGNVLWPPPCCSQPYPPANAMAANLGAVGFTDAPNGNFRLSRTSTYFSYGVGGVTPGVNQEAVERAITGVVQ